MGAGNDTVVKVLGISDACSLHISTGEEVVVSRDTYMLMMLLCSRTCLVLPN